METEIENFLQAQRDLLVRISRMVENLRKAGQANITAGLVKSRLQMLEKYWTKAEDNDEFLRTHRDALKGHDYLKKDFMGVIEEAYLNQKGALLDWTAQLAPERSADTTAARSETSTSRTTLPRIQLPQFTGKFEDWPSFRDLFQSIIGNDSSLSEVEKLHYLKVSLKSDADALIKNLPTIAENYQRAWRTLTEQYENKRLLVRSCLSKFCALPKMKNESAAELRKILHGASSTASTLESIGRPITSSEDLFVFSVVELLDVRARREWENSINDSPNPPPYSALKRFLERRLQTLEALQPVKSDVPAGKSGETGSKTARTHHVQKRENGSTACSLCKREHILMVCEEFRRKSAGERRHFVESSHLCVNCLGRHKIGDCPSKKLCSVCSEKHHTSLHDAFRKAPVEAEVVRTSHVAHGASQRRSTVLLATARIRVADRYGNLQETRALIDQGSEATIISEKLAQRLRLSRQPTSVAVFGVGGLQTGVARGRVNLSVWSRSGDLSASTSALILPRLTSYPSVVNRSLDEWPHLRGLELADPDFATSDSVEVLLGADVYASILRDGLRRGSGRQPVAQNTIFGWILSGKIKDAEEEEDEVSTHQCTVGDSLSVLVRRFWEQEELPHSPTPLTDEEQECEDQFIRTHTRNSEGRYTVRLPVRTSLPDLSETRAAAVRSLLRSEKRFLRDPQFSDMYQGFMRTYEDLNHMSKLEDTHVTKRVCYLPHHGVLKDSSSTTRLRVVFNGSWRVSSGNSLNQSLLAGRNLLPALSDVLLRWRWHKYVLAADVEKMYRQINVHEEDRDLQRIVWRNNSQTEINVYHLNTVTYGLACAPFLALRTLQQLAQDEAARYPRGSSALLSDRYVDDVLTGADCVEEALELQEQLIQLCTAGGFPLKKWASNDQQLLDNLPMEDRAQFTPRDWSPQEVSCSILGLRWNPETDSFFFAVRRPEGDVITKRSILSQTAQLFDPLGWLTPVIIRAKITIQSIWLLGLDWDTPLPEEEADRWRQLRNELPLLEEIRIPRALAKGSATSLRSIHGFADASERAYAAVVYLKTEDETGHTEVTLVAAKSKVAPTKQVSLPRLELCAALLLAQLIQHSVKTLGLQDLPAYLWTDSMVALGWIRGHSTRWKTYVANRVAEIQRLVPEARWNHLPGRDNPADCASRGVLPRDLVRFQLWWRGPQFLHGENPQAAESPSVPPTECLAEQKAVSLVATTAAPVEEHPMLKRYSDLHKLLRVTAWSRRCLPRVRRAHGRGSTLTAAEINEAEKLWIRNTQATHLEKEMKMIVNKTLLPRSSTLTHLNPFVDEEGILRVGGRITHSPLSRDEKHPIILPPLSTLARLIVESCHRRSLHGGTQLTLALVRQRFWIPRGRGLTKQCIQRCITCLRWRAAPAEQLMGDLPRARVTPTRPFQVTGVDYAGPVFLRASPGRGHKATKAFLVIFVCLSTKAVHLDVASDYTAEAFIAAFRRFTSRRGLCAELVSDCGTNFSGADAELRRLFAASTAAGQSIAAEMANSQVKWRFNPPAAPHFGGLWEAAVKSTKHHLRRVIGDAKLTFEEMATLLSQIEACLNSRPLSALTDDPEDVSALTPGHFLIGAPLTALPEPSLRDVPPGRLSRWELLQQMRDHFWDRWKREYLQNLVARSKWNRETAQYVPGQLCLLSHENTPPSKWPLARIVEVHPGEDGLVRVVTVRTATSRLKRPIAKLVLLPTESRDCLDI